MLTPEQLLEQAELQRQQEKQHAFIVQQAEAVKRKEAEAKAKAGNAPLVEEKRRVPSCRLDSACVGKQLLSLSASQQQASCDKRLRAA